jgi:hypothetical protein
MIGNIIQINDDFRIVVHERNLKLEQKKVRKRKDTKEEYDSWEDEGYYQELEVLCDQLLEYLVSNSYETESIEELKKAVVESRAVIAEAINQI